ncbi:hypothetical protein R1flu_002950 [Riccia fluitans]|uniref:Uncharacterized protein n=1 Tax=Riccia fluitans TaxID=41844 RepID=A0ABD1Y840_9MARC
MSVGGRRSRRKKEELKVYGDQPSSQLVKERMVWSALHATPRRVKKVAVKKITSAYENTTHARRMLREIRHGFTPNHWPLQALTDDHCQYHMYISNLLLNARCDLEIWFGSDGKREGSVYDRVRGHSMRVTVTEALEHPSLSMLHDTTVEPSAPAPFEFDFDEALELEGGCLEREGVEGDALLPP